MILTFADKRTRTLFKQGRVPGLPPDIARRAVRKLDYIHFANTLLDLAVPSGNRLHALKGHRRGQHAIRINNQWRICFRFRDGDAFEVEICDYHD